MKHGLFWAWCLAIISYFVYIISTIVLELICYIRIFHLTHGCIYHILLNKSIVAVIYVSPSNQYGGSNGKNTLYLTELNPQYFQ